jgi:dihydropyrimidinase
MLIKNGEVVSETEVRKADVLIQDGKITQVGDVPDYDGLVLDAAGMYVMPGAVEVNARFGLEEKGQRAADDFYTGTIAAACGGVTCLVADVGEGPPGCPLRHTVDEQQELAGYQSAVDYGFHARIQRVDEDILREMEELMAEGVTSFQFDLGALDDYAALELMKQARELGALLCAQAENSGIIKFLGKYAREHGFLSPAYHARTRPPESEAEPIDRLMFLSAVAGDPPLYITRLSTAQGLAALHDARGSGLKNIYAETCPHYLLLDESFYRRTDGAKFITTPPLRRRNHCDALWAGLEAGDIQVVASDHRAFRYENGKKAGAEDFALCPSGVPGIETRTPLLFSEGVMKRRIRLQRFVELCCANPAKLFGLYPKKGCLAPGSDADFMIFNPAKQYKLLKSSLHENVDYTVFESMELRGELEYTISRGDIIARNRQWVGSRGRGKFLRRDCHRKPV